MLGINQHIWSTANTKGFGYAEINGEKVLDTTEALGAFKNLIQLNLLKPYTRNLDIGGGEYDDGTTYLEQNHIANSVYDPFMRPVYHNEQVLNEVKNHPVDTVTSNSVLNVIDSAEARHKHITLSHQALKEEGVALFKVWQGNGSNQESYSEESYQSNCPAKYYLEEVEDIFGQGNVELLEEHHLIQAKKVTQSI